MSAAGILTAEEAGIAVTALEASIAARDPGDITTAKKPSAARPTRRSPADPHGPRHLQDPAPYSH
ncbi:hypothetical protein FCI23_44180 [Actinacidiphila oryziradicis]|uniref:Uncharacterized protein n=2 Tax=Actinacidiphila oryziradicis TaxID=2571141 RepID=A0A4U0RUL1_9ACTN|nr:hypothetical protein FCI23_44180 [Actinacidiphila oryziradicis]